MSQVAKKQKLDPNKLARRLLPNQSIRSDRKNHKQPPPPAPPPSSADLGVFVRDCSLKTEVENEKISKILLEIIEASDGRTKPKRRVKTNERKEEVSRLMGSLILDVEEIGMIDRRKMAALVERNHAPFEMSGQDRQMILGLNSILQYLECLRMILTPMAELIKASDTRRADSLVQIDSSPAGDQWRPVERLDGSKTTHGEKLAAILRVLKVVKYLVVFNANFNQQHLPIIRLLSTLISPINQALALLHSSVSHSPPLTPKSIQLVGFPFRLGLPILEKLAIKRLSCFAILDSAPGLEKLTDVLEN